VRDRATAVGSPLRVNKSIWSESVKTIISDDGNSLSVNRQARRRCRRRRTAGRNAMRSVRIVEAHTSAAMS
jgi:hypothetical protein